MIPEVVDRHRTGVSHDLVVSTESKPCRKLTAGIDGELGDEHIVNVEMFVKLPLKQH